MAKRKDRISSDCPIIETTLTLAIATLAIANLAIPTRSLSSKMRLMMSEIEKVIFASELVHIGVFRCPPGYPHFSDTGPIKGHLLVFPRTGVQITFAGGEPIIADPNIVMLYNQGQCYRRTQLSAHGDRCEWFAFAPNVLMTSLQAYDPHIAEQPERPFRFSHTPSEAHCYLRQRMVVEHLLRTDIPDQLLVEETMIGVLDAVLYQAYHGRSRYSVPLRSHVQRGQRELSNAVQEELARRFNEQISLTQLAHLVFCSPYHLCRIFRQHTGYSIHQYLNQLRLRTGLEAITAGTTDLTKLALELGYASHSHFTQAFHQSFGLPPSRLSTLLPRVAQLRKNLIA